MKLSFEQKLQLSQKLQLTPELIQSIEVLQLSTSELEEFIEEQLLTNPVLETESEYRDQYNLDRRITGRNDGVSAEYEHAHLTSETLEEHLLDQLKMSDVSGRERLVARYIIASLDDNGYMTMTKEEIMEAVSCSVEEYQNALALVQSFEPHGVGAENLSECLLIQLRNEDRITPWMEEIIRDCLEEVAQHKLTAIAKRLDMTVEEVQDICDEIRTLDPKPGRAFASSEETRYITPDLFLDREEGELKLLYNEYSAPKVSVQSCYQDIFSKKPETEEEKAARQYLSEKMASANALISNIEYRKNTIYQIASAIVTHQKEFFEKGEKFLKPLVLRQIAEETGVHESTVSRTVNGKYMETPMGVFELKYFFSSGLRSEDGEDLSANSVKKIIKELIDSENPKKPVSDQHIVDVLNGRGIEIARRTVAKYRESMGILSSQKRKRY